MASTQYFEKMEDLEDAIAASSDCVDVLINKLRVHKGKNVECEGKKVDCLFFSIKYTDPLDMMKGGFDGKPDAYPWPRLPQMPLILSDKETMERMDGFSLEPIIERNKGLIREVRLLPTTTEEYLKNQDHCVECGKTRPEFNCPICILARFCDKACYSRSSQSGTHSSNRCEEIKGMKLLVVS